MWTRLFIGVALAAALVSGQSIALERDGNIFIRHSDGLPVQITSAGIDSQPDLAADGTKVVFVRRTGGKREEIWIGKKMRESKPFPW
jgi:hypothetical protein